MISVVVCSRDSERLPAHRRNISGTIGAPFEYIHIDNSDGSRGLSAAYNEGVRGAGGDTLVFVHDDVMMMEAGWGLALQGKFAADERLGLVGVAGGQYLFAGTRPGWVAAGRPFIHGKVLHEKDGRFLLTVYSRETGDVEVVAVDGLFFAVRASLFERVSFDENTFDGFHFYDLDIAMQVRKTHRVVVTDDIMVRHRSGGSFDGIWRGYADRFFDKYRGELPARCVDAAPDPAHIIPFETFDITERLTRGPSGP